MEHVLLLSYMLSAIVILHMCQRTIGAGKVLWYTVDEGPASRVQIGSVSTDSGLRDDFGRKAFSTFRYNFLPEGYPHTEMFIIDDITGLISTTRLLDREVLCSEPVQNCILDLLVGALSTSGELFEIITVHVTVNDINDHSPVFPQEATALQIPESAEPGTTFRLPSATDQDTGNYSVQVYDLEYIGHEFSLQYTKDNQGKFVVVLVLNSRLDHEKQSRYDMWVLAYDGGRTPKFGSMQLEVTVIDSNDHAPTFYEHIYSVTVLENITVGSTLLRVNATDRDLGINGQILYKFASSAPGYILNTFTINNKTGKITLANSLNYEDRKEHHMAVEAVDLAEQPLTSQTSVVIKVQDINDNPPTIHFNLLSELPETTRVGALVAHITVSDSDTGVNGQSTCTLNTTSFIIANMYGNEYKLVLNTSLDRETTPSIGVRIMCHDHGSPILTGIRAISIGVQDVNEYSPEFSKRMYHAVIAENNDIGIPLLKVTATDNDAVISRISYYIDSNNEDMISIHPDSGLISTTGRFDHEAGSEYMYTVVAMDNGLHPLSSTATILIAVTDINDVAPQFSRPGEPFYIRERLAAGTNIGNITAHDPDAAAAGKFMFHILNSFNVPFELNPSSGLLKSTEEFDREHKAEYKFVVTATDHGSPRLTGSANITVLIKDVNDNEPVIIFPDTLNFTVHVPYRALKGAYVTKIEAYDADAEDNSKLAYTLLQGNDKEIIDLDPVTGVVKTARSFTNDDLAQYNMVISVSDHGDPVKSQWRKLIIDISIGNATALQPGQSEELQNRLIIIICISVLTGVFAVIVITAIIIIKRRIPKYQEPTISASRSDGSKESLSDIAFISRGQDIIRSFSPTDKLPETGSRDSLARQMPSSGNTGSQLDVSRNSFTNTGVDNQGFSAYHQSLGPSHDDLTIARIESRSPDTPVKPHIFFPNVQQQQQQQQQQQRHLQQQQEQRQPLLQQPQPLSAIPLQVTSAQILDMLNRLDAHSDTSGEVTSDSGRGHSEDDNNSSNSNVAPVNTNLLQVPTAFDLVIDYETKKVIHNNHLTVTSPVHPANADRVTSWMHTQKGRTFGEALTSFRDSDDETDSVNGSRRKNSKGRNVRFSSNMEPDSNLSQTQLANIQKGGMQFNAPIIVLEDTGSCVTTIHRDDYDTGSTTTSGSYVLDPEDIGKMYFQDVIV